MIYYLDSSLIPLFKTNPAFDEIMALRGEIFRSLENRRTQKISLTNKNYFIKQHYGIGWKEILKNLLQLRLPIISAKNEWQAIQLLQKLNIPTQTILGYGSRGINPAAKKSFLLTEELPAHTSLEHFCAHWKAQPPLFSTKLKLIKEIARIASVIHLHGINHRDFYLCHFLLPKDDKNCKLYLIDLHRAQIRKKTPVRWLVKDLSGLYFSSLNMGLTQKDYLRFMKEYRNKSLQEILLEQDFWKKVKQRGDKLYLKHAT